MTSVMPPHRSRFAGILLISLGASGALWARPPLGISVVKPNGLFRLTDLSPGSGEPTDIETGKSVSGADHPSHSGMDSPHGGALGWYAYSDKIRGQQFDLPDALEPTEPCGGAKVISSAHPGFVPGYAFTEKVTSVRLREVPKGDPAIRRIRVLLRADLAQQAKTIRTRAFREHLKEYIGLTRTETPINGLTWYFVEVKRILPEHKDPIEDPEVLLFSAWLSGKTLLDLVEVQHSERVQNRGVKTGVFAVPQEMFVWTGRTFVLGIVPGYGTLAYSLWTLDPDGPHPLFTKDDPSACLD